jgi:hypothetical protein
MLALQLTALRETPEGYRQSNGNDRAPMALDSLVRSS